jgi:hypothetical protein
MTDQEEKRPSDPQTSCLEPGLRTSSEEERPYLYRHAGIEERSGGIPLWLMLVVVGLLLWGVYYTIQFWNPG